MSAILVIENLSHLAKTRPKFRAPINLEWYVTAFSNYHVLELYFIITNKPNNMTRKMV
jgi:hypothetical protein